MKELKTTKITLRLLNIDDIRKTVFKSFLKGCGFIGQEGSKLEIYEQIDSIKSNKIIQCR